MNFPRHNQLTKSNITITKLYVATNMAEAFARVLRDRAYAPHIPSASAVHACIGALARQA